MQSNRKFFLTIQNIAANVQTLSVPDALFGSEAFVAIYQNPKEYLEAAIGLVADKAPSTHEKQIVGYAMQRLPAEDFIGFVGRTADSVENGVTDISVLEALAFPAFNWGKQTLIVHNQDPRVQSLLVRLIENFKLPETRKTYIRKKVMTGLAKQDYLDYLDTVGRHPEI